MKKVFLPLLLILCTVLLLGANVFAGSEGGERIAVLAKNTGTIDMTDATVKEDIFTKADKVINIASQDGGTATISAAWDEGALYFYVEIYDPFLTNFIQKYADGGQSDKQAQSNYVEKLNTKIGNAADHEATDDPLNPGKKLSDRYATESNNGAYEFPWSIPCVEIMIDPNNNAVSSDSTALVYQGRVAFDGYKASYVPVTDRNLSYNMYSEDRYTAVTNLEFNRVGKATGNYQIKMKFTNENLGVSDFESWDMVSVHPFVRFSTEAGGIGSGSDGYAEFDKTELKTDWDAPRYSYYRLWDSADTEHTGANASEVASKYTETAITTPAPITGIKPISRTSTSRTSRTTTTRNPALTTTPSGNAGGNNTTAATTTAAQGGSDKGGCGSVIGGAVAVVAAAMIAAPVIVLRKKDEE